MGFKVLRIKHTPPFSHQIVDYRTLANGVGSYRFISQPNAWLSSFCTLHDLTEMTVPPIMKPIPIQA